MNRKIYKIIVRIILIILFIFVYTLALILAYTNCLNINHTK